MTDNDWAGDAGTEYTERNRDFPTIIQRNQALSEIIPDDVATVLEVGCNIGSNLRAIKWSDPDILAYGLEINREARIEALKHTPCVESFEAAWDWREDGYNLVFTCGVLIHTDPKDLEGLCDEIFSISNKYVLCMEYFNSTPVEIPYRSDLRLWKRDFGSYYMDNFRLKPISTGFLWKPTTGMDNLTFWLFEKES